MEKDEVGFWDSYDIIDLSSGEMSHKDLKNPQCCLLRCQYERHIFQSLTPLGKVVIYVKSNSVRNVVWIANKTLMLTVATNLRLVVWEMELTQYVHNHSAVFTGASVKANPEATFFRAEQHPAPRIEIIGNI